jgi:hypothetical protein
MKLLGLKDEIFGGVVTKITNTGIMVMKKGVEVLYTQAEVEKELDGKPRS